MDFGHDAEGTVNWQMTMAERAHRAANNVIIRASGCAESERNGNRQQFDFGVPATRSLVRHSSASIKACRPNGFVEWMAQFDHGISSRSVIACATEEIGRARKHTFA